MIAFNELKVQILESYFQFIVFFSFPSCNEADIAQLKGSMHRFGSYKSTSAGIGGDLILIFQKRGCR